MTAPLFCRAAVFCRLKKIVSAFFDFSQHFLFFVDMIEDIFDLYRKVYVVNYKAALVFVLGHLFAALQFNR